MRAGDRCGLDDAGEFVGREAERVAVVAELVGRLPVDHGPFVESVAAVEGRAGLHGEEKVAEPGDKWATRGCERGEGDGRGAAGRGGGRVSDLLILRPAEEGARGVPGKGEIGAGVPAAEPRGAEGVVGEKEVEDRVFGTGGAAVLVRIRPHAHAGLVGGGAGLPGGLGEELGGGRQRGQGSRD